MADAPITRYTRRMSRSDDLPFRWTTKPRIDAFKHSLFYRSFKNWNDLPRQTLANLKLNSKKYLR